MRIYIDFDDVLCETAHHLLALAREMFDRRVIYEDIAVFDLQKAFALTSKEIDALMHHAHSITELAAIEPVAGGIDAVKSFLSQGHDLTVVTGRPASSHAGSYAWLHKYGLGHLELLHLDKYGRAAPDTAQTTEPQTLGFLEFAMMHFDVAIEDAPEALDLLALRNECDVIVYDRPWNRGYPHTANMRRVASWSEIAEIVSLLVGYCDH